LLVISNSKVLATITGEQRNVLQRFIDRLSSFFSNDDKYLKKLSPELRRAFREVYKEVDVIAEQFKASIEKVMKEFDRAWKEQGNTDVKSEGVKYSISGVNSKTADSSLLLKAEHMLDTGVDSETVRQETGWYKGYDGKMRYEISDRDMEVDTRGLFHSNPDIRRYTELVDKVYFDKGNAPTDAEIQELNSLERALRGVNIEPRNLGELIKHDKLFEAYPQLKDINVRFENIEQYGIYHPGFKEIVIQKHLKFDKAQLTKTLVHEIQHAIQDIEGFANGSNVEYWKEKRQDIADTIKGARQNLDLWLDDIGYSDFVKSSMQDVVAKKKTLEQHWEDCEKFKADSKYAEEIRLCEEELAKYQQQYDEITNGMTAYEQYENTAGEIEARDAASRHWRSEEALKEKRPDIDRENVVFAEERKPSAEIVTLDNGKQYVRASEKQVISGDDTAQWANQVADFINKELRNWKDFEILTVEGDVLTLTRDTAYKGGKRDKIKKPDGTYHELTDKEYRTKLNAEIHINELAEVAKKDNKPIKTDTKKHRFAKDGFTYRTAYFEDYNGDYYKITISIGHNGNVATVYNVGKIKKDSLPNGNIKTISRGSKPGSSSFDNSIAPLSENVNTQFSVSEDSEGTRVDKYTKKQYNAFGWAREAEAITKNELDDLYSKVQEKGLLKKFAQSSSGEAIIEVNDKPHTTLGVDNVFVFATVTKNNLKITKVVRFQAETDTEMEIIKEKLYERGSFSNTYYSFLKQYGIAREYSKKSALNYTEYEEKIRRRSSGTESDRVNGNSGIEQNGARTSKQTQSNEIAPINKASSADGVFFDAKKHSLSDFGEQPSTVGTPLRDLALAPTQEDIAPVAENATTTDMFPGDYAPATAEEVEALNKESFEHISDEDAPPEPIQYGDYMPDTISIDIKSLKQLSKALSENLPLTDGSSRKELENVIQDFSKGKITSKEELYTEVKKRFETYYYKERSEELAQIKQSIRKMPIYVSDAIKRNFGKGKDGYYNFMRKHIGKLRFSKDGVSVDRLYETLMNVYPDYFSSDIWNDAERLRRIAKVVDIPTTEFIPRPVDKRTLEDAADFIYDSVKEYKETVRLSNLLDMENAPIDESLAPPVEDVAKDIAPTVEAVGTPMTEEPVTPKAPRLADGTRGEELLVKSLDNYPMKTIEQKVAEKIRSVEGELADMRDLRREVENYYNNEIANLQKQYAAKKYKSGFEKDTLIEELRGIYKLYKEENYSSANDRVMELAKAILSQVKSEKAFYNSHIDKM